jgi:predicted Rossmann-fold nucleotide-binding protein
MAAKVLVGGLDSGFNGLSGGFETREELFEMTSWIQLVIHTRIVLLNIE